MTKITAAAKGLTSLGSSALSSLLGNVLQGQQKPYSSTLSLNGNDLATSNYRKNRITSNYNLSADEKNLMDYTNKELLNGLKNINVFSPDTQKNIQNQINAYKDQGLKAINEMYTPMLNELKTDIASRFGNLDNSAFMDNLNSIEKKRSEALTSLTQEILAKQNEIYEQELENRYKYLDSLSSTNQQLYSNILNFLNLANSSASR